mmetsp:Transcript_19392/g.57207  ORF Transcript_19392/g.57207 Transcript_19392/m.57207 type:complete len:267 (+) Transcript_19392:452-1252(+)
MGPPHRVLEQDCLGAGCLWRPGLPLRVGGRARLSRVDRVGGDAAHAAGQLERVRDGAADLARGHQDGDQHVHLRDRRLARPDPRGQRAPRFRCQAPRALGRDRPHLRTHHLHLLRVLRRHPRPLRGCQPAFENHHGPDGVRRGQVHPLRDDARDVLGHAGRRCFHDRTAEHVAVATARLALLARGARDHLFSDPAATPRALGELRGPRVGHHPEPLQGRGGQGGDGGCGGGSGRRRGRRRRVRHLKGAPSPHQPPLSPHTASSLPT